MVQYGSRTSAPEENCPQPKTNPNPNPNPNRGGQFSSGAIVLLPPTLNLITTFTQTPALTGGNFPRGANVQIPTVGSSLMNSKIHQKAIAKDVEIKKCRFLMQTKFISL